MTHALLWMAIVQTLLATKRRLEFNSMLTAQTFLAGISDSERRLVNLQ